MLQSDGSEYGGAPAETILDGAALAPYLPICAFGADAMVSQNARPLSRSGTALGATTMCRSGTVSNYALGSRRGRGPRRRSLPAERIGHSWRGRA